MYQVYDIKIVNPHTSFPACGN